MFIIIQGQFSLLISQNEKQQVKKHINSGIYIVGNKGPSGRREGALMVFSLSALKLFSVGGFFVDASIHNKNNRPSPSPRSLPSFGLYILSSI